MRDGKLQKTDDGEGEAPLKKARLLELKFILLTDSVKRIIMTLTESVNNIGEVILFGEVFKFIRREARYNN